MSFDKIQLEVQRDRRVTLILKQALQRSGRMTAAQVNQVIEQADNCLNSVVSDYPQFAEEWMIDFTERRLARERAEVSDFLKDKNQISQWLVAQPNKLDSDVLDYALSMMGASSPAAALPLDASAPFLKYLDSFREDLNWVDWGEARKHINTSIQAMVALPDFRLQLRRKEWIIAGALGRKSGSSVK